MEICVNAAHLRAALADIEKAERNGFHHCLAVFKFATAGPMLSDNTLRYSDIFERAHPTSAKFDWGRFQRVSERNRFEDGKLIPITDDVQGGDDAQ